MCDTVLVLPQATSERVVLFGKNSDRQRNEAHLVEYLPRAEYDEGAIVRCTYIGIPQARRTHGVLLCKPFWIWGAEMGANEHGVVIGNEGIYARTPAAQQPALIGMDLVRLALERAQSAQHAADVIVELLARYGQGGNCGHLVPSYYNNSFMIADAHEGFVLETIGREWLLERVRETRAISNDYSIGREVERTSDALPTLLREYGWNGGSVPNHAEVIADPKTSLIGSACERRTRATALLDASRGRLCVAHIMSVLRDHPMQEGAWNASTATKNGICVHPGLKDRNGQTTGTMASEVRLTDSVHWVTATAAPCISIFKPVLLDVPLPPHGPAPTDRFDPLALWWRHELLHRAGVLGDFAALLREIQGERDALESKFRANVGEVLNGGGAEDRARVVAECWQQAMKMEDSWHLRITSVEDSSSTPFAAAWAEFDRLAGIRPAAVVSMRTDARV